ncbi:hypothetical protein VYA_18600 [Vibrio alfacsensis]|nr:hypothetical protein VYA_18600 [Vibrio alfacsensis]
MKQCNKSTLSNKNGLHHTLLGEESLRCIRMSDLPNETFNKDIFCLAVTKKPEASKPQANY